VLSARPIVYTIPPHRAFADALAAGLIARFGGDKTSLAQGLILVPNNRASRALTEAFVRRSEGGLLLPRLVPVGDPDLDERIGGALEPLGEADAIPPAIEPTERLFLLARLVQQHMPGDIDAAEALRLAQDLSRTLDQLLVEEIEPGRLRDFVADLPDLSIHWHKSLDRLRIILEEWPALLRERGRIDLTERRNRLLAGLAKRWREAPPRGFVVAAGITTAAPAVARLLRVVARLPRGMVVLPAVDTGIPEAEWEALGPHEPDPVTSRRRRSIETHPQFHLKLLLDRMGVARAEVERWRWGGGRDAPAVRSRAIANAMAPAAFTSKWQELKPAERRLSGVRALELADPSEEAQAIAIALREAVEQPGRTAGPGHTRSQACPPCVGSPPPLGHRSGRQRRPPIVGNAARHSSPGPCRRRRRGVRAGFAARCAEAPARHARRGPARMAGGRAHPGPGASRPPPACGAPGHQRLSCRLERARPGSPQACGGILACGKADAALAGAAVFRRPAKRGGSHGCSSRNGFAT
jgi:ATP-dependent helicase/nuclease subunit B